MSELAFSRYRPVEGLSLVRAYLSAGAGIVRRDAVIRASYRGTLFSSLVSVVFTLATFYFVAKLVRVPPFHTPAEYFGFTVVGIVVFGLIRSSLNIPLTLRQELVAGTYERLVLSPFGGTAATVALMVFPILYALAMAVVELGVAVGLFGVHVTWNTAALALPLAVVGALAFAPFALVFAAITLAFKQAPGQNAALAVFGLASGLYFPVALLPWWLRWVSQIQPFTPTVALLRHVLIGFPLPSDLSVAGALARIAGFIVIGIPLAVALVSVAGRYGRKRGTIIEY
jgi:ABC-type polysaccharide/polyol phosphate export permease